MISKHSKWGGGFFLLSSIFVQFGKEKFWENFGNKRDPSGTSRQIIGLYQPVTTIEISKIRVFDFFTAILAIFYFQNRISRWARSIHKVSKNVFGELLWALRIIFIEFWIDFEAVKLWNFWNFVNVILSISPVLIYDE